MRHMQRLTICIAVLCSAIMSGCEERREALGGGGIAPVKVKLLVENTGSAAAETAASDAPKIEGKGTFKGTIKVVGNVPTLNPLLAKGAPVKDAICANEAVPDESVIVGDGGGLANVFVYLRRVPNVDVPPPPTDPITVDQQGCKFVPHALVCRVGQPLKLINSDPVAHNVGLTGLIMSFNQTLGGGDKEGITIQYDRAEPVPVKARCDFHGWMQAWQLAVDHPWFALTGPDGTFEIKDVPAGEMEFVVWHEKAGNIERAFKVNIPADGEASHDFEVNSGLLSGE